MADCLFCSIVAGEVPATVVREDARTVAFRDINPQAPAHVLIIPRVHAPDVGTLAATEPEVLVAMHLAAAEVARSEGVGGSGWRLVFNTGADAGQTVPHVHGHVLGGRNLGWPPG